MTSRAKQSEAQSDNAKQISLCYFQGVWRSAGFAFGIYTVHSRHRNANIGRLEDWKIGRLEGWKGGEPHPIFQPSILPLQCSLCLRGEISPSVLFRDSCYSLMP